MNWKPVVLSAALLWGCGGGGSGTGGGAETPGEAIKISYFRSNFNPLSKKVEPTYRVVMSDTWKDTFGASPREPFPKAAAKRVYTGFLPDRDMRRYLDLLLGRKIESLTPSEPESYDPQKLREKALHAVESEYTRIITIGTDKRHRSYSFRDQQSSVKSITTFLECEKIASQIVGFSLMIETGAEPFIPKTGDSQK